MRVPFVDLVRAGSLVVVVLTRVLWLLTWALQAMPLYLLHSTGMALALYGFWRLTGKRADNLEISGLWWVTRPIPAPQAG